MTEDPGADEYLELVDRLVPVWTREPGKMGRVTKAERAEEERVGEIRQLFLKIITQLKVADVRIKEQDATLAQATDQDETLKAALLFTRIIGQLGKRGTTDTNPLTFTAMVDDLAVVFGLEAHGEMLVVGAGDRSLEIKVDSSGLDEVKRFAIAGFINQAQLDSAISGATTTHPHKEQGE